MTKNPSSQSLNSHTFNFSKFGLLALSILVRLTKSITFSEEYRSGASFGDGQDCDSYGISDEFYIFSSRSNGLLAVKGNTKITDSGVITQATSLMQSIKNYAGSILDKNYAILGSEDGVRLIFYRDGTLYQEIGLGNDGITYAVKKIELTNYAAYNRGGNQWFCVLDFLANPYTDLSCSETSNTHLKKVYSNVPHTQLVLHGGLTNTVGAIVYTTNNSAINLFGSTNASVVINSIGKVDAGIDRESAIYGNADGWIILGNITTKAAINGWRPHTTQIDDFKILDESPILAYTDVLGEFSIYFLNMTSSTIISQIDAATTDIASFCYNFKNGLIFFHSKDIDGRFILYSVNDVTCNVQNCMRCKFNENYCFNCKYPYLVEDGQCVTSCSGGRVLDKIRRACVYHCPKEHQIISGVCQHSCTGGTPYLQGGECVGTCTDRILETDIQYCLEECPLSYFDIGTIDCIANCGPGNYSQLTSTGTFCYPCDPSCETCSGGGKKCTACSSSYSNPYLNPETKECFDCMERCATCDNNLDTCLTCKPDIECNKPSSSLNQTDCKCCYKHCTSCTGEGNGQCTACKEGYRLEDGFCWKICPEGQNLYKEPNICGVCDPACKTCSSSDPKECTSCWSRGKLLPDGKCLDCTTEEDSKLFPSEKEGRCINCVTEYNLDLSACPMTREFLFDIKDRTKNNIENNIYYVKIGLTSDKNLFSLLEEKVDWQNNFGFKINTGSKATRRQRRVLESLSHKFRIFYQRKKKLKEKINIRKLQQNSNKDFIQNFTYKGKGILEAKIETNEEVSNDTSIFLFIKEPVILEDENEVPKLIGIKQEFEITYKPVIYYLMLENSERKRKGVSKQVKRNNRYSRRPKQWCWLICYNSRIYLSHFLSCSSKFFLKVFPDTRLHVYIRNVEY